MVHPSNALVGLLINLLELTLSPNLALLTSLAPPHAPLHGHPLTLATLDYYCSHETQGPSMPMNLHPLFLLLGN